MTISLYVETNFEFKVTSVVVIELVASADELSADVKTKLVEELYIGVTNPIV